MHGINKWFLNKAVTIANHCHLLYRQALVKYSFWYKWQALMCLSADRAKDILKHEVSISLTDTLCSY